MLFNIQILDLEIILLTFIVSIGVIFIEYNLNVFDIHILLELIGN